MEDNRKRNSKYFRYVMIGAVFFTFFTIIFIELKQKKNHEEAFLYLKKHECVKVGLVQSESFLGENRYTYKCKNGKTHTIAKEFNLNAKEYSRYD